MILPSIEEKGVNMDDLTRESEQGEVLQFSTSSYLKKSQSKNPNPFESYTRSIAEARQVEDFYSMNSQTTTRLIHNNPVRLQALICYVSLLSYAQPRLVTEVHLRCIRL